MDEHSFLPSAPDPSGPEPLELLPAWISVQDASRLFSDAGMARNKRTIRRYCERGDLDCRKTENALHQPQYFIDPGSVAAYIEQQRTLLAGSRDMSGLAQTVPDMTGQDHRGNANDTSFNTPETLTGVSRISPDAPGHARPTDVLATQLAERLRDKDQEIAFLRGELLHRRTTDTALHDVIAAFRANAEAQRLAAAPRREEQGTSYDQPPMQ